MQCSIKRRIIQRAQVRLHVLVVLSLLVLAMVGRVPDSEGGWLTCPPQAVIVVPAHRRRGCKEWPEQGHDASCWLHLFCTWYISLSRSLLLWASGARLGFDTIETAQLFLGVFEKVYRFTPFSQDAQPRIRGKCPLELAGYDISQVPMASLCAGWSLAWPLEVDQNLVPNS
jgi:hypothetical protein